MLDVLVEQHHKLSFSASVDLANQQLGSKLRMYFDEKACSGEAQTASEIIETIEAQRSTGRPRSNIENVAKRTRRWLIWRDEIKSGQYFDKEDSFRQIDRHDSEVVRGHTAGVNRWVDRICLGMDADGNIDAGGLLGPVSEGKRPETGTVALPAANTTDHGGTGMTIAKLRAARLKLATDENDLDRMTVNVAITPNQTDDILAIVEAAGSNINLLDQDALKSGRIPGLIGFRFVETNLLYKDGNIRSCPVWTQDHVCLGVWEDVNGKIWNDGSADNLPYAKVCATMDATRKKDEGVHILECDES